MRRARRAKIVATLGPATSDVKSIRALFARGADVFRLNFSHGSHADHAQRFHAVRSLEREFGRPIGVLLDLQGPKLRLGTFAGGSARLQAGTRFRLDLDPTPGDVQRAPLPHPEIFAALRSGTELLLDDGRLHLQVDRHGAGFAETTVVVGGTISDRKGVNVPSVVLPISPLTAKDRDDLDFGLQLGVDWIALSFVQRPEDIEEVRAIVGRNAWIMAKLEKPPLSRSSRHRFAEHPSRRNMLLGDRLIDIAFGFFDLGPALVSAHALGIDTLGQFEQPPGDHGGLGIGPRLP